MKNGETGKRICLFIIVAGLILFFSFDDGNVHGNEIYSLFGLGLCSIGFLGVLV